MKTSMFTDHDIYFFVFQMLTNYELGCSQTATSFSDIIVNQCSAIAEGVISGFGQFAHDPKFLNQTVQLFNQQKIPSRFPDAVVLRHIETQKLDDIWDFPLNMTCENTVPLPWTVCEATRRNNGQGAHSYEYNIMRIIDFIGRNYVRMILPQVDTSEIRDEAVRGNEALYMNDKRHMYLGAWHRDLIPRIVNKVAFYPRQNAHKLFEYTGYDIFVHNILFGNAAKRMNDLMAGEDEFELCYDPFRTHGSALGAASYLGIDNHDDYATIVNDGLIIGSAADAQNQWAGRIGVDGFTDAWIHDTRMSGQQFKDIYRKNVWYEAPVARNYHVRHSIHSRRFIHSPKIIMFPLDILPFGYSTASSLPTAALAGDCGYISIDIFDDWFDRSFYLTRMSDIPVLFPVVNHQHFVPGDVVYNKPTDARVNSSGAGVAAEHIMRIEAGLTLASKALINNTGNAASGTPTINATATTNALTVDTARKGYQYIGWVNPNSIGRFGRADYWAVMSGLNPDRWTAASDGSMSDDQKANTQFAAMASVINNTNVVAEDALLNGYDPTQLESVVPHAMRPNTASIDGQVWNPSANQVDGTAFPDSEQAMGVIGNGSYTGFGYPVQNIQKMVGNTSTNFVQSSKAFQHFFDADRTPMILRPSDVSPLWAQVYSQTLQIKLLQVGFQTLPSIRQFLAKLPNIYITTEWNTDQRLPLGGSTSKSFQINNDIYIQAIVFWFIPQEPNGIESMRLYPHHLHNHEMPVIPGLRIANEQSQGVTIYDWHMMNEMTPHLMGMNNPLLENMGIISFTPKLSANKLPHAYYDTNISGWIGVNILEGDEREKQTPSEYNVKNGTLRIISIGCNGVASVNLNLYRLIF